MKSPIIRPCKGSVRSSDFRIRSVHAIRARLREGLRGQPGHHLRQGRHRGRAGPGLRARRHSSIPLWGIYIPYQGISFSGNVKKKCKIFPVGGNCRRPAAASRGCGSPGAEEGGGPGGPCPQLSGRTRFSFDFAKEKVRTRKCEWEKILYKVKNGLS